MIEETFVLGVLRLGGRTKDYEIWTRLGLAHANILKVSTRVYLHRFE